MRDGHTRGLTDQHRIRSTSNRCPSQRRHTPWLRIHLRIEIYCSDKCGHLSQWIGEADRWERARQRYGHLSGCWPQISGRLPRYFAILADYSEGDYRRLIDMLAWIEKHPVSRLYPRQLPVSGLDSKWLEKRKGLLADLVGAVQGRAAGEGDLHRF